MAARSSQIAGPCIWPCITPSNGLMLMLADAGHTSGQAPLGARCCPSGCCPSCSADQWAGMETEGPPCTVFFLNHARTTQFLHATCTACGHVQRVDGQEFALLRISPSYAFSYEILYHWQDLMGRGGIPWSQFWDRTMMR